MKQSTSSPHQLDRPFRAVFSDELSRQREKQRFDFSPVITRLEQPARVCRISVQKLFEFVAARVTAHFVSVVIADNTNVHSKNHELNTKI